MDLLEPFNELHYVCWMVRGPGISYDATKDSDSTYDDQVCRTPPVGGLVQRGWHSCPEEKNYQWMLFCDEAMTNLRNDFDGDGFARLDRVSDLCR